MDLCTSRTGQLDSTRVLDVLKPGSPMFSSSAYTGRPAACSAQRLTSPAHGDHCALYRCLKFSVLLTLQRTGSSPDKAVGYHMRDTREYALAYSEGSSTRGYGIYIQWPDATTSRVCGPMGEETCSFDCELKAVAKCLKIVTKRQQEEAAVFGVIIFTYCRGIEQTLGGFSREDVRKAVLLADHLKKTEKERTVVQLLPM
ncbi:hypothetical protein PoB_006920200 [Plakobranchus ocellatus]|uniref:Lysozyme n=1 Tax=Plakobranchus ocellatus TaxID=259542 RepID=A0AAV4DFA8_9GAST|nr:hypothetical protein PoB_006920200 [Plakobranchus ocellatus]